MGDFTLRFDEPTVSYDKLAGAEHSSVVWDVYCIV